MGKNKSTFFLVVVEVVVVVVVVLVAIVVVIVVVVVVVAIVVVVVVAALVWKLTILVWGKSHIFCNGVHYRFSLVSNCSMTRFSVVVIGSQTINYAKTLT